MKKIFYLVISVMALLFAGCEPNAPEVTGVFSVSETKQVTFSKGNLQYHSVKNVWRFAEKQWECIDYSSADTRNGWLDLFAWSTSATNFGTSASTDEDKYSGSFVDWGTNAIGNDAPNMWRTMTYDEWNYLLGTRPNASSLKGVAQVNGVNGLILLPDNWTCPEGISFKTGCHSSYGTEYYEAYQSFTADQWSKMELEGAVFLPAAGGRTSGSSTQVDDILKSGYYWANKGYESNSGYMLYFDSQNIGVGTSGRQAGMSVRLVKNVE
jgi:hypothetical protein